MRRRPLFSRKTRQEMGHLARERGHLHEQRALEAWLLPGRPAWLRKARAATPQEDCKGIDLVVESDVGKLYLQVKSSMVGQLRFQARHQRLRVAVVIVEGADGPSVTLSKISAVLGELRAQYLALRGHPASVVEGEVRGSPEESSS